MSETYLTDSWIEVSSRVYRVALVVHIVISTHRRFQTSSENFVNNLIIRN